MVKGRRDYSFATVLELMDRGTIVRAYGIINNGYLTLYTVPAGKKAYIYSMQLNYRHCTAGPHEAILIAYDGVQFYYIMRLQGPDNVDQASEAIGFTVMSIPAGWSLVLNANLDTTATACCVVVEVDA